VSGEGGKPLYCYRFGDIEFDEARFELRASGMAVDNIQARPLELLVTLLEANGEVVTSDTLLRTVWRYQSPDAVQTNVIGTTLTKLRRALGKEAERIINVPKKGYRFEGPVERIVVGRTASEFTLRKGMPVPRRENWFLEKRLAQTLHGEVWQVLQPKSGNSRVYKFALSGSYLPTLKKEAALLRLLRETLGDRPDFVRLIDWDFAELPFFLELDDGGQNLAEWAEDRQHLRAFSFNQRLSLFLQIADAVAAAHHVGVLHRDLKPTNVLVAPIGTDRWQLCLTDFGSAHALDPEQLAEFGITPRGLAAADGMNDTSGGTPLYLAPELIAGQPLTVKSDVYALGLLLYQMMIGNLHKTWAPGWERDIDDELLREDIAAATDGDPAYRLASAAELADRLRRLEARHAEREYRRASDRAARAAHEALKRSRARRPWLIASVAILIIGLGITTWLYRINQLAFHRADRERSRAEAINQFLNDDLIGYADPITPGQQHERTIAAALDRAVTQLNGRFPGDPRTRGTIELSIGKAYFGLAKYMEADAHQRRAIELLSQASGPSDALTLEASYVLVRTLILERQVSNAETLLTETDQHAGPLLSEPTRLALLASWTRGGLAAVRLQPAEALASFEAAEKLRVRAAPDDAGWLFKIRGNIGWALNRLHREQEAAGLLHELASPDYSPEHVGLLDWCKAQFEYGLALTALSQSAEAIRITENALEKTQRALGPDHYVTGIVWSHIAAAYRATAQWDQALIAAANAYRILLKQVGAQGRATLDAYSTLGAITFLAGNVEGGLRILQDAHKRLTDTLGSSAPFTQINAYYLASALSSVGKAGEAYALVETLDPDALTSVEPGPDWQARLVNFRQQLLEQKERAEQQQGITAVAKHR